PSRPTSWGCGGSSVSSPKTRRCVSQTARRWRTCGAPSCGRAREGAPTVAGASLSSGEKNPVRTAAFAGTATIRHIENARVRCQVKALETSCLEGLHRDLYEPEEPLACRPDRGIRLHPGRLLGENRRVGDRKQPRALLARLDHRAGSLVQYERERRSRRRRLGQVPALDA